MILRLWLVMLALLMVVNARVASPYLLGDAAKPLPFLVLAVTALVWVVGAWHPRVVIVSCSILVVGTLLRGAEVFLYAEAFHLHQRVTGITLWWFISGTTMSFGVLDLIVASRRQAEEWAYHDGVNT